MGRPNWLRKECGRAKGVRPVQRVLRAVAGGLRPGLNFRMARDPTEASPTSGHGHPRASELAVFDALFYIRIRRIDEPA